MWRSFGEDALRSSVFANVDFIFETHHDLTGAFDATSDAQLPRNAFEFGDGDVEHAIVSEGITHQTLMRSIEQRLAFCRSLALDRVDDPLRPRRASS